jgi:hypothetical protein
MTNKHTKTDPKADKLSILGHDKPVKVSNIGNYGLFSVCHNMDSLNYSSDYPQKCHLLYTDYRLLHMLDIDGGWYRYVTYMGIEYCMN